jgi:hypothetical protein
MRTGGILGSALSMIRTVANAIAYLARWSFTSPDEEESSPPVTRHPGPAHGPVPAIELRRQTRRKDVPPG